MSVVMSDRTTIPLRRKTRDRVKLLGKEGETYDDVIVRILDQAELATQIEAHYDRLREKSEFICLDEI